MRQRTFIQHAIGIGFDPVIVVVKIDNDVIYHGPVKTLESQEHEDFTGTKIKNIGWSWSGDPDFQGTREISISVSGLGSTLVLGNSFADNPYLTEIKFKPFWQVNNHGINPFRDVVINGVPQMDPNSWGYPGQYWWKIPSDGFFTATMVVDACDQGEEYSEDDIITLYATRDEIELAKSGWTKGQVFHAHAQDAYYRVIESPADDLEIIQVYRD